MSAALTYRERQTAENQRRADAADARAVEARRAAGAALRYGPMHRHRAEASRIAAPIVMAQRAAGLSVTLTDGLQAAFEAGDGDATYRAAEAVARQAKEIWQRCRPWTSAQRIRAAQGWFEFRGVRPPERLHPNMPDILVTAWAAERATEATEIIMSAGGQHAAYDAGADYVTASGLEPPEPTRARYGRKSVVGALAKMGAQEWWLARARRKVLQITEEIAIAEGRTHRMAGLYVSDAVLEMYIEQRRRNWKMLESLTVVNESGETILNDEGEVQSLAEVARSTISNPSNRRIEFMVRSRGMEEEAEHCGHLCLFVNWTLSSKYHARRSASGDLNDKWVQDGCPSPRIGQDRLTGLWASVRKKLGRMGVRTYGMRVAEPHHDGTPHWHMVLYFESRPDLERAQWVIADAAFRDEPDEAGALEARLKFPVQDPRKGDSPTAYLAKYLAKNLDGYGLDSVTTPGDGGEAVAVDVMPRAGARRVAAWAATWHISQFQFFGTPPIQHYRELRRLRDVIEPERDEEFGELWNGEMWGRLERARVASDSCAYRELLRASGGVNAPRAEQRFEVWRESSMANTRFGEPRQKAVRGLRVKGNALDLPRIVTRPHQWEIVERATQVAKVVPILAARAKRVASLGPVSITVRPGDPAENGGESASPADSPPINAPPGHQREADQWQIQT